jgi:hypothetical protein
MRDVEIGSVGEARIDLQRALVAQFCKTWQPRLNLQLDGRNLSPRESKLATIPRRSRPGTSPLERIAGGTVLGMNLAS